MELQGIVNAVFSAISSTTTGTIGLQRVEGPASAWTGPSDKELQAILNDVYDPATRTLRIVEV